jgi:hypothetical protein
MSKSNHISECKFSDEMLAYLYGEIGEKEKSVFESHLSDCSICTDELADSAFARFSVQQWRDAEFAHLETPLINIPFETKAEVTTGSDISVSWLERLRRLVSLSPTCMTAGGAFATLAICIGLLFGFLNLSSSNEVAENNDKLTSATVSPISEIAEKQTKDVYAENTNTIPVSKKTSESPNRTVEITRSETLRENKSRFESKNSPIKIKESIRKEKPVKQFNAKATPDELQTASKTVIQSAVSPTGRIPALSSFDEEEDNTLRLAELFNDIDSEK